MTTQKQSCRTCRWAEWERTPTGRIKQNCSGQCVYPVAHIRLPDSITENVMFTKNPPRNAIWTKDGTNCPCWEERTE